MPWSGRRAYDQPYTMALNEISAQVQTLRGKGYRQVLVGGQGAQTLTINDMNQGRRRNMAMSAETLLSYFDPDGLGHMPKTSANFKKPVPVLWVMGTQDPLYPAGEAYAFAKLPAHAKSRYLVVEAGHGNTPEVATAGVIEWLKGLE